MTRSRRIPNKAPIAPKTRLRIPKAMMPGGRLKGSDWTGIGSGEGATGDCRGGRVGEKGVFGAGAATEKGLGGGDLPNDLSSFPCRMMRNCPRSILRSKPAIKMIANTANPIVKPPER